MLRSSLFLLCVLVAVCSATGISSSSSESESSFLDEAASTLDRAVLLTRKAQRTSSEVNNLASQAKLLLRETMALGEDGKSSASSSLSSTGNATAVESSSGVAKKNGTENHHSHHHHHHRRSSNSSHSAHHGEKKNSQRLPRLHKKAAKARTVRWPRRLYGPFPRYIRLNNGEFGLAINKFRVIIKPQYVDPVFRAQRPIVVPVKKPKRQSLSKKLRPLPDRTFDWPLPINSTRIGTYFQLRSDEWALVHNSSTVVVKSSFADPEFRSLPVSSGGDLPAVRAVESVNIPRVESCTYSWNSTLPGSPKDAKFPYYLRLNSGNWGLVVDAHTIIYRPSFNSKSYRTGAIDSSQPHPPACEVHRLDRVPHYARKAGAKALKERARSSALLQGSRTLNWPDVLAAPFPRYMRLNSGEWGLVIDSNRIVVKAAYADPSFRAGEIRVPKKLPPVSLVSDSVKPLADRTLTFDAAHDLTKSDQPFPYYFQLGTSDWAKAVDKSTVVVKAKYADPIFRAQPINQEDVNPPAGTVRPEEYPLADRVVTFPTPLAAPYPRYLQLNSGEWGLVIGEFTVVIKSEYRSANTRLLAPTIPTTLPPVGALGKLNGVPRAARLAAKKLKAKRASKSPVKLLADRTLTWPTELEGPYPRYFRLPSGEWGKIISQFKVVVKKAYADPTYRSLPIEPERVFPPAAKLDKANLARRDCLYTWPLKLDFTDNTPSFIRLNSGLYGKVIAPYKVVVKKTYQSKAYRQGQKPVTMPTSLPKECHLRKADTPKPSRSINWPSALAPPFPRFMQLNSGEWGMVINERTIVIKRKYSKGSYRKRGARFPKRLPALAPLDAANRVPKSARKSAKKAKKNQKKHHAKKRDRTITWPRPLAGKFPRFKRLRNGKWGLAVAENTIVLKKIYNNPDYRARRPIRVPAPLPPRASATEAELPLPDRTITWPTPLTGAIPRYMHLPSGEWGKVVSAFNVVIRYKYSNATYRALPMEDGGKLPPAASISKSEIPKPDRTVMWPTKLAAPFPRYMRLNSGEWGLVISEYSVVIKAKYQDAKFRDLPIQPPSVLPAAAPLDKANRIPASAIKALSKKDGAAGAALPAKVDTDVNEKERKQLQKYFPKKWKKLLAELNRRRRSAYTAAIKKATANGQSAAQAQKQWLVKNGKLPSAALKPVPGTAAAAAAAASGAGLSKQAIANLMAKNKARKTEGLIFLKRTYPQHWGWMYNVAMEDERLAAKLAAARALTAAKLRSFRPKFDSKPKSKKKKKASSAAQPQEKFVFQKKSNSRAIRKAVNKLLGKKKSSFRLPSSQRPRLTRKQVKAVKKLASQRASVQQLLNGRADKFVAKKALNALLTRPKAMESKKIAVPAATRRTFVPARTRPFLANTERAVEPRRIMLPVVLDDPSIVSSDEWDELRESHHSFNVPHSLPFTEKVLTPAHHLLARASSLHDTFDNLYGVDGRHITKHFIPESN